MVGLVAKPNVKLAKFRIYTMLWHFDGLKNTFLLPNFIIRFDQILVYYSKTH